MVSLSDIIAQWEVLMSPMIQKFQLNMNINLTKKTALKNTYPFGRSSDDRQTDTHTHRQTDMYLVNGRS